LQDLIAQDQCLVVALSRSGRATLPSLETQLEACDIVHLSATSQGIAALQARLKEG
jgi:hypothetical protein